MSIHPRFARAILEGKKRVEFRKRRLADDIDQVFVYATSPIQRIVGRFFVSRTTMGTPTNIWNTFGHVGAIDRDAYDRYFANLLSAVAIEIREAETFAAPIKLTDLARSPVPPQSFAYAWTDETLEAKLNAAILLATLGSSNGLTSPQTNARLVARCEMLQD